MRAKSANRVVKLSRIVDYTTDSRRRHVEKSRRLDDAIAHLAVGRCRRVRDLYSSVFPVVQVKADMLARHYATLYLVPSLLSLITSLPEGVSLVPLIDCSHLYISYYLNATATTTATTFSKPRPFLKTSTPTSLC